MYLYVLKGKKPVPVKSLEEWGKMWNRNRRVAETEIEERKSLFRLSFRA